MLNLEKIKILIKGIANIHRTQAKPDIFIFTTARSGSTFLMELIGTQRGIKYCGGPLDIRKLEVKQALGVNGWEELFLHPNREEIILEYFNRLRNNKIPTLNHRPFSTRHRFLTNRIVFKILHGGEDMIARFRLNFHGQIVYLIRHPIAVTISREVYPRLHLFLENREYRSQFSKEQLVLSKAILQKGNHFEKGILSWCLQNYPPLHDPDRSNWITISYEELVVNPEPCIQYLAKKLDLSNPEKMLEMIHRPSPTVRKSDGQTREFFRKKTVQEDRSWLIQKWKDKISEEDEKKAFDILKTFDMDAYSFDEYLPSKKYLIAQ